MHLFSSHGQRVFLIRACRYGNFADMPILVIADMPIFSRFRFTEKVVDLDSDFADIAQNADIQISAISALKMFADSRYADIDKKCRYADICRCRYKYRHTLNLILSPLYICSLWLIYLEVEGTRRTSQSDWNRPNLSYHPSLYFDVILSPLVYLQSLVDLVGSRGHTVDIAVRLEQSKLILSPPECKTDDTHVVNMKVSVQGSLRGWGRLQGKLKIKKNTYALKTPHVVALPFIHGVECIQFHTLLATLKTFFDLVTLIFDL